MELSDRSRLSVSLAPRGRSNFSDRSVIKGAGPVEGISHACRLLGVLYLGSQTEAPGLSWLADNVLILVGCIWATGALPGGEEGREYHMRAV